MSAAEPAEKNVLIFRSFAPVDFAGPLESALRVRAPWQINFYVESLDNGRLADEGYEKTVAATLQHSYRGHKLDLLIAEWSPALRFAVRHRDELFPGVPIVFVGVDTTLFVDQKLWSGVTGVTVTTDVSRTINLALHLHPDTNTVAIIIGDTDFERYWLGKVHSELARHQVKEIDFVGLPAAQLLRRVAALPPRTVVLFEEEPQDSIQPAMGPYDILAWAGQRLPTYCIFGDECVNHGGIGGDFMDVGQQLSLSAEIATRVLAGQRPEDIPVVNANMHHFLVDSRALNRWNIPESALPPGSVVLNRPPSFWQLYKRYIFVGIFVIWAQTLAIFALLWQRAMRRRTEAELRASQNQLEGIVESAMDAVIAIDDRQHIVVFNAAAEKMFGSSATDVVGGPIARLIPERFHEVLSQHIRHFGDTGATTRAMGPLGSLWGLRRSGEEFPIEASISQTEVSGRKLFTVIIRDVTERRQAEEALSSVSRRLIEAHEEERTWIARELHDDINQRVAMLAINLQELKQDRAASEGERSRRMDEACESVSDLGNDIQALSHRLHSSKLEYLGLVAACEGYCRELSSRLNVEIAFHSQDMPQQIPQEISLCLFRVLQEALQNGVKHSGARQFEVSLNGASSTIQLSVSDSGLGFDPENGISGHGLGLISMRERLKLVDGQFSIDSKPQRGTTIRARIPLGPRMKSAGAVA